METVPAGIRIAYLTAGAAGMYCGSCLRDNALAAALVKRGIDCQLIPTYTPIRTDEESLAIDQIFFGGINVFLQQKSAFFRRLPRWLDRLLDQPWLINAVASRGMKTSARDLGELTVAMLQGDRGPVRKEVHRLVDWLATDLRPSLVNLTNILIGGCIPAIKRELRVPVVVTLQGDDLFLLDLIEPYRSRALDEIRRIASEVDAFVTFSNYYADFMAELAQIDRSRIHVIPMGIRVDDWHPVLGERPDRPPTVGYFARICPAKGFHLLIDAFIRLREMPGTELAVLRAAGWLGEGDKPFFEEQLEKLDKLDLLDVFHYAGVVDRLEKKHFFHGVDLLCVPTTYQDPKGLFALESLASGVPVVLPAHGAFPELIASAGGGELVEPGDADRWAERLHALLLDPDRCRSLGAEGRKGVERAHTADLMADRTLEVYQSLLAGPPAPQAPLSGSAPR